MSEKLEMARKLVELLEAEEKKETLKCVENNRVQLSSLNPGDTFKIGEHDFIVLEQIESSGVTKVISKGFMAEDEKFDDDCINYGESYLKRFIENEIQPVIEQAVGADNLVPHYANLMSVDMQHEFEQVECKVRPITFDEARKYNDLLVNKEIGDWWWTCTPWSTEGRGWKYAIAVVSPSGGISNDYCVSSIGYDCYGVRPFCILKSNIFVSRGE